MMGSEINMCSSTDSIPKIPKKILFAEYYMQLIAYSIAISIKFFPLSTNFEINPVIDAIFSLT